MRIVELILDEENEMGGVFAISLVDKPAIEENFIMLSEEAVEFATVDQEKRIVLGAALVPNKMILRKDKETGELYYVYFTKETIAKTAEKFFKQKLQDQSTLQHAIPLEGVTAVESWIVEDEVHDKTRKYNLSYPVGTWVVASKIYNDEVWENYVKTGKVMGYSIEGNYREAVEMGEIDIEQLVLETLLEELQ